MGNIYLAISQPRNQDTKPTVRFKPLETREVSYLLLFNVLSTAQGHLRTMRDGERERKTDRWVVKQTERERGKERLTDAQADRQRERKTDRQTHGQAGRQKKRKRDRQMGRQAGRERERKKERQMGRQIDRERGQTDKCEDRQTDRQRKRDRQMGRQMDREKERETDKWACR